MGIPENFLDCCLALVQKFLSENMNGFKEELVKMEFLKNSKADGTTEQAVLSLLTRFAELLVEVYRKQVFDFSDSTFRQNLNSMLKQGMEIREIRGSRHFVFFIRIVFGLLSMLMKLGATIDTARGCQTVMGWKMGKAS